MIRTDSEIIQRDFLNIITCFELLIIVLGQYVTICMCKPVKIIYIVHSNSDSGLSYHITGHEYSPLWSLFSPKHSSSHRNNEGQQRQLCWFKEVSTLNKNTSSCEDVSNPRKILMSWNSPWWLLYIISDIVVNCLQYTAVVYCYTSMVVWQQLLLYHLTRSSDAKAGVVFWYYSWTVQKPCQLVLFPVGIVRITYIYCMSRLLV